MTEIGWSVHTEFSTLFQKNRTVIKRSEKGTWYMLWTIALILLILWLIGFATDNTLSGFIHILLVLAIAAVLIQLITGRRPV